MIFRSKFFFSNNNDSKRGKEEKDCTVCCKVGVEVYHEAHNIMNEELNEI